MRDGKLRLFREHDVTMEAVLASACLPFLHHAIEIEGESDWDGGYSANPPLRQLVVDSDAEDIILVQLLPEDYGDVPHSTREISKRMMEISFATSLTKELEAIEDLRRVCELGPQSGAGFCRKLKDTRLHRVIAGNVVEGLRDESALDTRWSLLGRLKESGRLAAESWLAADPVGSTSVGRQAQR